MRMVNDWQTPFSWYLRPIWWRLYPGALDYTPYNIRAILLTSFFENKALFFFTGDCVMELRAKSSIVNGASAAFSWSLNKEAQIYMCSYREGAWDPAIYVLLHCSLAEHHLLVQDKHTNINSDKQLPSEGKVDGFPHGWTA